MIMNFSLLSLIRTSYLTHYANSGPYSCQDPNKTIVPHILAFCLFLFFGQETQANNDEAARLALTKILNNIRTLQGEFIQYEYDERGRPQRVLEGKFMMANKINLRWEVEPPYSQLIISNEENILIYDADLRQLLIRDLEKDKLPHFFFLANNPEALKYLTISRPDLKEKTFILSDDNLDILVHFRRNLPAEISWINEFGHKITIQFNRLRRNRNIEANNFQFEPPPGTDIIIDD